MKNQRGGAGVLLLVIICFLIITAATFSTVNHFTYTNKYNTAVKAMERAVTSAIQEVNISEDSVEIKKDESIDVFLDSFSRNTGLENLSVLEDKLYFLIVDAEIDSGENVSLNHYLKKYGEDGNIENLSKNSTTIKGILENEIPDIEIRIHEYKSREFKNQPYFVAVVKDWNLGGLFTRRSLVFNNMSASTLDIVFEYE